MYVRELTLGPLRSATGFLESRLLTLDSTRISSEKLLGLERRANERIVLDEGAGDPEFHGISLTGKSAA